MNAGLLVGVSGLSSYYINKRHGQQIDNIATCVCLYLFPVNEFCLN